MKFDKTAVFNFELMLSVHSTYSGRLRLVTRPVFVERIKLLPSRAWGASGGSFTALVLELHYLRSELYNDTTSTLYITAMAWHQQLK